MYIHPYKHNLYRLQSMYLINMQHLEARAMACGINERKCLYLPPSCVQGGWGIIAISFGNGVQVLVALSRRSVGLAWEGAHGRPGTGCTLGFTLLAKLLRLIRMRTLYSHIFDGQPLSTKLTGAGHRIMQLWKLILNS